MATHGMNPKIDHEQVIAYAAGMLPRDVAAKVEAYLESPAGAADAATVARYRLAQGTFASDDSVAPPDSVVAKAKAIFERFQAVHRPSWLEKLDRVMARLIFDSRVNAMAVRYSLPGIPPDRFSLSFEGEGADVDLQAERIGAGALAGGEALAESARWRVMGQVGGTEAGNAHIALAVSGTDRIAAEGRADESGVFTLEATPGRYDVFVELPGKVLVLPRIEMT